MSKQRFALDALFLLRLEIWLAVLIPDHLVVGALGGIGSPALILGASFLPLWAFCVLTPSIGVARQCVPVRILLACAWVTILISYAAMNTRAVPNAETLNSERFIITMAAFSGVALVAAEGLRDRMEVLVVLRTIVAGIAVMAFIGILQFRPGIDLTRYLGQVPFLSARGDLTSLQARGGFTRPSSTALHPIEFGVIVASALPFAVHLLLYDKSRAAWRRWLPLGLIGLAIPVSISRSAFLVAVVGMVYFFGGAARAIRWRVLAATAVFAVIVFMGIPGMIGTLKGYFLAGNSDSSVAHRSADYPYAAPFLRHSPWVGRGPGTFLPSEFRILDNQYLLSAIEVGLVGLVALICVVGAPTFLGRGARRRSPGDEGRGLGQALAGSAAGFLVAFATYDALSFPTFTDLIALVLGLSGAVWCLARVSTFKSNGRRSDLRGATSS